MIFIICRGHSGACSLLAVEAISQACGDSSMPCKQFWANERSHVSTHKIVSLLWLYMFKASNWNLSRDASDYGQRNVSKIKKNNQSSDAERRGPLTKAEIQRNYQTGRISLATPFWSSSMTQPQPLWSVRELRWLVSGRIGTCVSFSQAPLGPP